METFSSPAMWAALGNIILVNIVLSGDNAVVIAMAARGLQGKQQKQAIIWGSAAAIGMRVVLTLFAVQLLQYPYLKIVGALLLLYIGIQLLAEGDEDEDSVIVHTLLWAAVRTIMIADLVMSLDNVIGVAAAAKGNATLLIIGLAISIPLIVFGSTIMLKLMSRFPIIITLGGALLGYLAGDMFVTDPAIVDWVNTHWPHHDLAIIPGHLEISLPGVVGAIIVVIAGKYLARRAAAKAEPVAAKD
ncbi:MAG: TerC family protein [Betaproteobacteria bacterium]